MKLLAFLLQNPTTCLRSVIGSLFEHVHHAKSQMKNFEYNYVRAKLCYGIPNADIEFAELSRKKMKDLNEMEDGVPFEGEDNEQRKYAGIVFFEEFLRELRALLHAKAMEL